MRVSTLTPGPSPCQGEGSYISGMQAVIVHGLVPSLCEGEPTYA